MAAINLVSEIVYANVIASELEGRSESVSMHLDAEIDGITVEKDGTRTVGKVDRVSDFYGRVVTGLCANKIVASYLAGLDHATKLKKLPILLSGAKMYYSREFHEDEKKFYTTIEKIVVNNDLLEMVKQAVYSSILG